MKAETFGHVSTFSDALKKVEYANPDIFRNPARLWNVDETAVDCQYGERNKVFGSSATHHGGYMAGQARKTNKHITLVVAVSASGGKVPPLFIVEGKRDEWVDLST